MSDGFLPAVLIAFRGQIDKRVQRAYRSSPNYEDYWLAAAMEKYGKIALGLKALGHPVRITIVLQLLRQGECVCGDISSRLPVAASTASQHLNSLLAADLIKMRIDGPRRYYRINPRSLEHLQNWMAKL